MVARSAATYCRSLGDEVAAITHADLDISDRDSVFAAFERLRPSIVLNCAAYTNVDDAETNVEKCYAANAVGPENLAAASSEFGSVFVTISTDYVFDGERDGFYTEDDEPNPQGVYAKSKYEGERRAAAVNPDAAIVRSGWIYGEFGTNFLSVVRDLLARDKKIAAISDSFGTPTYAFDLAVRLRELAGLKASGIFHVTNHGPGASYFEFAREVAGIGGFDPELIEPVSKDSLDRPAPRPANSRLACVRIGESGLGPLRDWKAALSEYLGLMNVNAKGGT
jgi:dTDP-4-dehydrorhamnose reductase